MASDGNPVQIPAISLVHGSQAPTTATVPQSSGKALPPRGNAAATTAAANARSSASNRSNDLQAQVAFLNKYLNDSGRPDQFRVDPNSDSMLIQEVNPATGAVVAEYPSVSFPALAKSLGISSAVIDEHV
jgi:uncharacterized FlaG/YvyC family protein